MATQPRSRRLLRIFITTSVPLASFMMLRPRESMGVSMPAKKHIATEAMTLTNVKAARSASMMMRLARDEDRAWQSRVKQELWHGAGVC
jgi:hypothetical protein